MFVIGIAGGTGSGKSTILNLIPRLQDVTGGEILVNGNNIKDYKLTTLRDRISYAPQKAILFEGTIRSNMLIGKEDASDEEIEKALKMAEVDFIESLEDGVSQGASNYSGGQKQRLQLARSILAERDFYLFDDCFSALDMNTEAKVKENLKSLKENLVEIDSTFAISVTKGVNTDINNYLFGSILSINETDIIVSVILSILVILLYVVSYNKIFAITFDEKFAKSIGINTNLYNMIFASLCSIVVVLGMRLMGSLLISSLIVFPAIIAKKFTTSFKGLVVMSVLTSVICFVLGIFMAFFLNLPTGAGIVLVYIVLFTLSLVSIQ